jgi:putative ATP-dependent endonuclease of OLD family
VHLSKLTVRGFRASAEGEIEVNLPGRFSVLVGANAAGKTTVSDALYLRSRSCTRWMSCALRQLRKPHR